MERLKQMSLKKALFTITFINSTAALLLSALSFWGCLWLRSFIAPEGYLLDVHSDPVRVTALPKPSENAEWLGEIITAFQFILPMLIFTLALLFTASAFYRLKLKDPLEILSESAGRIIGGNLDFEVEARSRDELGQLCIAFETMRKALLDNNRRLWQQAQERKRLNAAFSHNLRNPLTVLKGAAKLARQGVSSGAADAVLFEHLSLIESYTNRLERYVETMSGIQRLEEISPAPEKTDYESMVLRLKKNLSLLAADGEKKLHFEAQACPCFVFIDTSILFQIAENLVSNALRFSREHITVSCRVEEEMLTITVSDDGCGFPDALLKNGIRPFQKGNEDAEHFGMGLYTCQLLAARHGGRIIIHPRPVSDIDCTGQSTRTGASVSATLKIR